MCEHVHPKTLYQICLKAAVSKCSILTQNIYKIRELPDNVLFDVYYTMYEEKRLCLLVEEFNNVTILLRMFKVKRNRFKLLKSYQAVLNHGSNHASGLLSNYSELSATDPKDSTNHIDIGLRIAAFFIEGGWYLNAINILNLVEDLCKSKESSTTILLKLLDCYHKRLRAESIFCMFKEADVTHGLATNIIEQLKSLEAEPNLAGYYSNVSTLYFVRSEYDKAYDWTIKSLQMLSTEIPSRIIVEILRQASKTCVVKRLFKQAKLLIDEAVAIVLSSCSYDSQLLYSDVLMDYGYYFLNYDSIQECVSIYHEALAIRKKVFGKDNIHVAIGHEDLAYALYVKEYSSGRFYAAKENAIEALRIMDIVLPKQHLIFAFAMRVKALILEEIALDLRDGNRFRQEDELLVESEKLHQEALNLSYNAFGEHNVQTAKHYGNLGRLYQTMMKYEAAEAMHLKAIAIKEEIFGIDDYEVGLSIGHLASLYSYHMNRHIDAEKLYKRSIAISLKLFGPYYSGLEYDYRGLIHVYSQMNDINNLLLYARISREWKLLREGHASLIEFQKSPQPILKVKEIFFSMC